MKLATHRTTFVLAILVALSSQAELDSSSLPVTRPFVSREATVIKTDRESDGFLVRIGRVRYNINESQTQLFKSGGAAKGCDFYSGERVLALMRASRRRPIQAIADPVTFRVLLSRPTFYGVVEKVQWPRLTLVGTYILDPHKSKERCTFRVADDATIMLGANKTISSRTGSQTLQTGAAIFVRTTRTHYLTAIFDQEGLARLIDARASAFKH